MNIKFYIYINYIQTYKTGIKEKNLEFYFDNDNLQ